MSKSLAAVYDIRFYEKLFNDRMTELDKCVADLFFQPRVPSTSDNNRFTES
jgi:hypothetical protein